MGFTRIILILSVLSVTDGSFVGLLSSDIGIYYVTRNGDGTMEMSNTKFTQSSDSKPVALTQDQRENVIFWSDQSSSQLGIWRKKEGQIKRIINYKDMRVLGMDVDWVGKILYWTDAEYRTVRAANYEGKFIFDVTAKNLLIPRAIAVDAVNRTFYVGDQGAHNIMRCNLDGSYCSVYEHEFLPWPNQIILDYSMQKVHVVDGWSPQILSCSWDFTSCNKTFVQLDNTDQTLFGISRTDNNVVATTFHGPTLYYVNEPTTSVQLMSGNGTFYYMLSNVSQPAAESSCQTNARCPQLCFPRGLGALTVCTSDELPSTQGELLLYLDRERSVIGITSGDFDSFRLSILASSRSAYAMTYDQEKKEVYFSDTKDKAIYVVEIIGRQTEVFMTRFDGIDTVTGLAFDELQQRLYYVNLIQLENRGFTHNCVEMVTLALKMRRTILCSEDRIKTMDIDSDQRYVYVATETYVSRFTMDGQGEVRKRFQNRVGSLPFTVDHGVFSFAVSATEISSSDFTTLDPIPTTDDDHYPFVNIRYRDSSSVVYIADPSNGRICKPLNRGTSCNWIPVKINELISIDLNSKVKEDQGTCAASVCSDDAICFRRPDKGFVSCQCPSYGVNVLSDDRKTCKAPKHYAVLATDEGLSIVPLKSRDTSSIYKVAQEVGKVYGLTKDNNGNIYFTDGRVIFTMNMNTPEEINILTSQYSHFISELAFSDEKVFWIGTQISLTDDPDEIGIFYKALNSESDITRININITVLPRTQSRFANPRSLLVNPSSIYWVQDRNVLMHYDRIENIITRNTDRDIGAARLNDRGRTMYVTHWFGGGVSLINMLDKSTLGTIAINIQYPCGIEVKGHFLYILDCSDKTLFSYNMRSQQKETKAVNVHGVGQMVTFGVDFGEYNQVKPGVCGTVDTSKCSKTRKVQCSDDYDCLNPRESKCCYQDGCQVCTPVQNDGETCSLNVNNTVIQWAKGEDLISSDCKTCSCSSLSCSTKVCPRIECHKNETETPPGQCCNICSSFMSCNARPQFKNCPIKAIELLLPDMQNATDTYASIIIDRNHPSLRNIVAMSCSGQVLQWNIDKTEFTWQKETQYIWLTARDADLQAVPCKIPLNITDNTPPRFLSFPKEAGAVATTTEGAVVRWSKPVVYDNSGHVTIKLERSGRDIGDMFPLNYTTVTYIAWDGANNGIMQSFTVYVDLLDINCGPPPSIANGVFKCKKASNRATCQVKCNEGFLFNDAKYQRKYECGRDGKYTPASISDIGTACFEPQTRLFVQRMSTTFNCYDSTLTIQNGIDCLNSSKLCPKPEDEIKVCDVRHLSTDVIGTTATLNVSIEGNVPYGISQKNEENIVKRLKTEAENIIKFFGSGNFGLYCPNIGCSLSDSAIDNTLDIICPNGSVKHRIGGKIFCGKCPQGSWFKNGKCHLCPSGWYQDKEGQFNCIRCEPPNVFSPVGSWMKKSCQLLKQTDVDETKGSVSPFPAVTVGVVTAAVLILIIVAVVVVICYRRRRNMQHETSNDKSSDRLQIPLAINNQLYIGENPSDAYDEIPADANPYEAIGDVERGACASAADPYSCLMKSPHDDDYEKFNSKKNKSLDEETPNDAYTSLDKNETLQNPYDDLKFNKK